MLPASRFSGLSHHFPIDHISGMALALALREHELFAQEIKG
jgi:hypothetical protein